MLRKVKVKDIHPNPFQSRKNVDADAIKSLAEEIGKVGLWTGALRGREKNGHIELCFGHRRLEAIKVLGWKEVEIDIAKLSDEDMALQALIENLQREGLNDADRGDGIAAYIKLRSESGITAYAVIREEVGSVLGLSTGRINELLRIAGWDEKTKEPIRQQKIAGRSAVYVDRLAGAEGVKVAAEKGLGFRTVMSITEEFGKITDEKVKEKVRERFTRGDISSADDVVKTVRQAKGQVARKAHNVPPDLIDVMREWTERAHRWTGQLEEVSPYIEYIDSEPRVAEKWRTAVRNLVEKLNKFV